MKKSIIRRWQDFRISMNEDKIPMGFAGYDNYFKTTLQNRQVEWWKEEPSGPDDEFDY